MSENRRMKISDLHPHPKNAEIYGMDEDVSDLVEKIKRSGQVHTLVVTSKGIVLAGHRRMKACKELGINEVDVEIRDFDTSEQEIEYIIDNNATREKTNEQKAREAIVLKETLSALAEKRKLSKLKQNQTSDMPKSDMPKMAQREDETIEVPNSALRDNDVLEQGKTRDIIAPKVGLKSGQEVDRAIKTVKKIDELKEEGRTEDVELLRGVMNNRGISAAENLAKNIDNVEIPEEDREAVQSGCKSPNSFIKKANEKIETSKNESVEKENSHNEKLENILAEIQKRYSNYLELFQQDVKWLLAMEFYQNDEDVTGKVCSDLQNCLEKFMSIRDMICKMKIDEFGSIDINK